MHSKRNVWWWLMSWNVLLLLSACVQDIEIKPKDGVGKVVVSCVLRNEKIQDISPSRKQRSAINFYKRPLSYHFPQKQPHFSTNIKKYRFYFAI